VVIHFEEAIQQAKYHKLFNCRKYDQLISSDRHIVYKEGNDFFGIPFVVPHFNSS
jgi:hypothetical protein